MNDAVAPKKTAFRPRVLLGILVAVAITYWAYRGLRWDPRFEIGRVRGLTPDQAIARLGSPDVDPRTQGWTPADEAAGEPLKLFYHDPSGWLGQEYVVIFKGNVAVDVSRATK